MRCKFEPGRSLTRVPLLRHSNQYKYQSISRHPLANRDPTTSPQIERASFLYHGNLDVVTDVSGLNIAAEGLATPATQKSYLDKALVWNAVSQVDRVK